MRRTSHQSKRRWRIDRTRFSMDTYTPTSTQSALVVTIFVSPPPAASIFRILPMSIDHVTLVTVDDKGVDIANLRMSGIFDKTGHIPLGGDDVCFERAACRD